MRVEVKQSLWEDYEETCLFGRPLDSETYFDGVEIIKPHKHTGKRPLSLILIPKVKYRRAGKKDEGKNIVAVEAWIPGHDPLKGDFPKDHVVGKLAYFHESTGHYYIETCELSPLIRRSHGWIKQ